MPLPKTSIMPNQLNEDDLLTIKQFNIDNKFANLRLDVALGAIIPEISRTRITNWIKQGQVFLDNKVRPAKYKVTGGEEVIINANFEGETLNSLPENIPLDIIYEDEHLLVLNKPAGLIVHPGNGNWNGTLLNALLFHYPKLQNIPRAGIVHRLDKDTSGLMMVAKTLLSQVNLIKQLQQREVTRIYRAIVCGNTPLAGVIDKNMGRDPRNRIKMTTLEVGGKPALTKYRVLQYWHNFSYIECKLETGRTHQIRVHLKSIKHPLVADNTYGNKKINYLTNTVKAITNLNRQALHAIKLSFIHPVTQEQLSFQCAIPEDIKQLITSLNEEYQLDTAKVLDEDYAWEVFYVKE